MVKRAISEQEKENRRKWICRRMTNNAEKTTLTENQHRALAILSTYRHMMHCGKKEFFRRSSGLRKKFLDFLNISMPIMLRQANLPPLYLGSLLNCMPDDEMARELGLEGEFYVLAENTCESAAEKINEVIESYLRGIDKKYGTWYAPTGLTRDATLRRVS